MIDVARIVGATTDVAAKISALKQSLEATSDSHYLLSRFPLHVDEAEAMEAVFGIPKIVVHITPSEEIAETGVDGEDEHDADDDVEGEDDAMKGSSSTGVASKNDVAAAVDNGVLERYARELFAITPGVEGDFELKELRTAFQPLVWLLVAADGNARTDDALALATRVCGYTTIRVGKLYAEEIEKGTAAGRVVLAAQTNHRTIPALVTVSIIASKMRACVGSKFIIEGFPRAKSIGFPMCHDQIFELEATIGTVHNVLFLDDDVTCGAASTSNAMASVVFNKEQQPTLDHFNALGKVFTVDTRTGGENFTDVVREILT
jgi:adenylate kinase family enzyme